MAHSQQIQQHTPQQIQQDTRQQQQNILNEIQVCLDHPVKII
jgi:hypothetical protein